MSTENTRK